MSSKACLQIPALPVSRYASLNDICDVLGGVSKLMLPIQEALNTTSAVRSRTEERSIYVKHRKAVGLDIM